MKERPILFSGEMIRAILDGRKTMTRRVVKLRHMDDIASIHPDGAGAGWIAWSPNPVSAEETARLYPGAEGFPCPYGAPGDRLWVREAWAPVDYLVGVPLEDPVCIGYRATETAICHESDNMHAMDTYAWPWDRIRWRPSIHMPRWASRIDLDVTSVRVEQVQDIGEADARAEGVTPFPLDPEGDCWTDGTHRSAFEYLWGEINGWDGPKSFASNPWVWVLSFRRVRP